MFTPKNKNHGGWKEKIDFFKVGWGEKKMQVALNSHHVTQYFWAFEVAPCFFVFENPVVIFVGQKNDCHMSKKKRSRGC